MVEIYIELDKNCTEIWDKICETQFKGKDNIVYGIKQPTSSRYAFYNDRSEMTKRRIFLLLSLLPKNYLW